MRVILGRHVGVQRPPAQNVVAGERDQHRVLDIVVEGVAVADAFHGDAGNRGNQLDQAVKIELACDPPFPLDIIVRTPHNMKWRLAEGDSFLSEVTTTGRVLYEKVDEGVGAKSRGGFSMRAARNPSRQRSKLRHRVLSLSTVR